MSKNLFVALVAGLAITASAQSAPAQRPRITGISHVGVYAKDLSQTRKFYGALLGFSEAAPSEKGVEARFNVGKQYVTVSPVADAPSESRLSHVAFTTDNAEGLRAYLGAHGVAVPSAVETRSDGSKAFEVRDPEGNRIEFVQDAGTANNRAGTKQQGVSKRIIHAGFAVRDRAAEDHFYKDLLGFHVYWHGGMKDELTDWIDMQVPDGTDWLEYMMMGGRPLSPRESGIVNHFALGVPDIHKAAQTLQQRGWKSSDEEHVQIGRDGKWQLNLYDPDLTRAELMEFRPVEKPCCSEYSGPHPK